MYKVVFVCGLSRRGTQRQMAFISNALSDVRLDSDCSPMWKELHLPLIDVQFFKEYNKALNCARMYAPDRDIFIWDRKNKNWKELAQTS